MVLHVPTGVRVPQVGNLCIRCIALEACNPRSSKPRVWPRHRVSATQPEGHKFETCSHRRYAVYTDLVRIKSVGVQKSPVGLVRKLGEAGAGSGIVLFL
ncbi:hypothetical protein AVEN_16998-1 [Araneus ventricosus]|uniref:Uncharacterized protein n=1 Tax=Araneus ventricosus TaxID=182803 RepID=A0A4Y2CAX9_ARAVE|nr:hypothetical protein AVEN_16998-1 [Araneus ventricosus]